jgi:Mg2+-importing ATPase
MIAKFWSTKPENLFKELRSGINGLSNGQAETHLKNFGKNILSQKKETGKIALFLNQFKSPIVLILIFASILSFFLSDHTDTYIILAIVFRVVY